MQKVVCHSNVTIATDVKDFFMPYHEIHIVSMGQNLTALQFFHLFKWFEFRLKAVMPLLGNHGNSSR